MTEIIKDSTSTISQLTGAQAVQAMLMLVVTITLMVMIVLGRDIPEFLTIAFFTLLGIYMELPSLPKKPT